MKISRAAVAGTLDASDLQVTVEPGDKGISLEVSSSMLGQYGRQIKKVILDTLKQFDIQDIKITVVDKGAPNSTVRARVECAIQRAAGIFENMPWGGPGV